MPVTKKQIQSADRQVTTIFLRALQGATPDVSEPFTTEVTMTTGTVEVPLAEMLPGMREWDGDRKVRELSRNGFEFKAKPFELTVGISRDAIEDDTIGVYRAQIETLAYQTRAWRGQQVMKTLEANPIGYDDKALFATDHPEGSGTAANLTAGANPGWYLFDTTKPTKTMLWGIRSAPVIVPLINPDDPNVFFKRQLLWGVDARGVAAAGMWQYAYKSKATLDATNVEAAISNMRARKDSQGESLDITPNLVVVPPALEWTARRLFGQATLANGEENIHAGGKDGLRWVISNRLTGA